MRTRQPYLSQIEEWLYSAEPRFGISTVVVDCHRTVDRADTNLNGQKSWSCRSPVGSLVSRKQRPHLHYGRAGVDRGMGGGREKACPINVAGVFSPLWSCGPPLPTPTDHRELSRNRPRLQFYVAGAREAGRACKCSHNRSVCPGTLRADPGQFHLSQRSLHYEPIFRLLLKVAVKGTH